MCQPKTSLRSTCASLRLLPSVHASLCRRRTRLWGQKHDGHWRRYVCYMHSVLLRCTIIQEQIACSQLSSHTHTHTHTHTQSLTHSLSLSLCRSISLPYVPTCLSLLICAFLVTGWMPPFPLSNGSTRKTVLTLKCRAKTTTTHSRLILAPRSLFSEFPLALRVSQVL